MEGGNRCRCKCRAWLSWGQSKNYMKSLTNSCVKIKICANWMPSCQAYSLAGRSRMLGIGQSLNSSAEDDVASIRAELAAQFYADGRHTLYLEYLKILAVTSQLSLF